jgi:hypothetical protein
VSAKICNSEFFKGSPKVKVCRNSPIREKQGNQDVPRSANPVKKSGPVIIGRYTEATKSVLECACGLNDCSLVGKNPACAELEPGIELPIKKLSPSKIIRRDARLTRCQKCHLFSITKECLTICLKNSDEVRV